MCRVAVTTGLTRESNPIRAESAPLERECVICGDAPQRRAKPAGCLSLDLRNWGSNCWRNAKSERDVGGDLRDSGVANLAPRDLHGKVMTRTPSQIGSRWAISVCRPRRVWSDDRNDSPGLTPIKDVVHSTRSGRNSPGVQMTAASVRMFKTEAMISILCLPCSGSTRSPHLNVVSCFKPGMPGPTRGFGMEDLLRASWPKSSSDLAARSPPHWKLGQPE